MAEVKRRRKDGKVVREKPKKKPELVKLPDWVYWMLVMILATTCSRR